MTDNTDALSGNSIDLQLKRTASQAEPPAMAADASSSTLDQRESQASYALKLMLSSGAQEDVDLDCLLLQDTDLQRAPLQLHHILTSVDQAKCSQAEILFLLVYIVALESGFAADEQALLCADFITRIPATTSYHSKNVLCLSRFLPTYTCNAQHLFYTMQLRSMLNSALDEGKLTNTLLSAVVTGDLMVVTLTPELNTCARGSSICLSIGRYVLSGVGQGKPLHRRFRRLDELSYQLREKLYVPVTNQLLQWLELQPHASIMGLPIELYDEIFQYLSKNQLNILANVNSHLHYLVNHSKFMKRAK